MFVIVYCIDVIQYYVIYNALHYNACHRGLSEGAGASFGRPQFQRGLKLKGCLNFKGPW
jgi:hypothetical protein